ncbi:MAG: type IV pilin-like G/H family protein [Leptolyngbyaceae cyanobacterium bins.302]|nr:type IV pilin-like G/H family protein [Leptolyngbyaceae cyanobacterium bins.302]
MTYCLNPTCPEPTNSQNQVATVCLSCGFQLLLQNRFRAIKPIGQGGFGRTFLAVDEQQPGKPPCVIKQSMPDQLMNRERADELFHQEALRLAELGQHPQIPHLITDCQQENYQYLVQEFIEGQTLAQALSDRGQFTPSEIEQILHSLLPVLEFIHAHEVIHRDIKPDNIIRRADGQVVLVDFGSAKHATGTALLKTGTMIGSVEYIAPEQTRGKATYASDLYSLGVTCIHLLTQMSPFDLIDGDNQWVWQDWMNGKVSPELRHCLNKMIAPASNRRFQSATEVREFLANPQLPNSETPTQTAKAIAPTTALQPRRPNNLRKPLTTTAIVAFSVGAIAAAITLPRFAAEVNRAKETEARTYVASMGRGQQAYYLEKNQFTSDLQSLGIGIRSESENYSYKISTQGKTSEGLPFIQNVAIPKKGDLKNYVGYVWVFSTTEISLERDMTTMAIVCESNQLNIQIPTEQSLMVDAYKAACPPGYTQLSP